MAFLQYFSDSQAPQLVSSLNASENSDEEFILLSRISAHLSKFNFMLQCGEGRFYSAEYLSHVARFTANTMISVAQLPSNCAQSRWLRGELPIAYTPQIELTPQETMQYIPAALRFCRDSEGQRLLAQYAKCVENLRKRLLG